MPVIQSVNRVTTQTYHVVRAAVGVGAIRTVDVLLDTPGLYQGGMVTIDIGSGVGFSLGSLGVSMANVDNSELVYGQNITTIRVMVANNSLIILTPGLEIVLFVGV